MLLFFRRMSSTHSFMVCNHKGVCKGGWS